MNLSYDALAALREAVTDSHPRAAHEYRSFIVSPEEYETLQAVLEAALAEQAQRPDLKAISKRLLAANEMVRRLCLRRDDPESRDWVMSIPAQPDRDPDLVISAALADIPKLAQKAQPLTDLRKSLEAAYRNRDCTHGWDMDAEDRVCPHCAAGKEQRITAWFASLALSQQPNCDGECNSGDGPCNVGPCFYPRDRMAQQAQPYNRERDGVTCVHDVPIPGDCNRCNPGVSKW